MSHGSGSCIYVAPLRSLDFPVESDGDEEEFIALNKNVNAVFIRDHIKKRLETVESLTDFRNKLLYGNRIQRETGRDTAHFFLFTQIKWKECSPCDNAGVSEINGFPILTSS